MSHACLRTWLAVGCLLFPAPIWAEDTLAHAERAAHLERLGVFPWHRAGIHGRGMTVAILDSGFRGYRDALGRVLPAHVLAHSCRRDGNLEARDSHHGILCGEVIHALAPEAKLVFANWDNEDPRTFLEAARWARKQGARILTCSVIMPSWSDGEGGGAVHRALTEILGEDQTLCFACAGNTAERHWSGPCRLGPKGWHEWAPGQVDNRVTPWSEEPVSLELCAAQGEEFEVLVWDSNNGDELDRRKSRQDGQRSSAIIRLTPVAGRTYQVRVRSLDGKPRRFHLVALGGMLEHSTAWGSIPFPGDGAEVLAVGAVGSDGRRQGYSSCGPMYGHAKPDFVAEVPFATLYRSRPFSGTSAAAPQAAGLAALLWSRHPEWNAGQVRRALIDSARDLGTPGHDPETGHGHIALPLLK